MTEGEKRRQKKYRERRWEYSRGKREYIKSLVVSLRPNAKRSTKGRLELRRACVRSAYKFKIFDKDGDIEAYKQEVKMKILTKEKLKNYRKRLII